MDIQKEAEERNVMLNDEAFRDELRQRRYVPLHVLPNVRWEANFDTLEGSAICFEMPTLVTAQDTGTFDCATICNDSRAAYFFVRPNDRIIVNGVLLMSGGYCTTNSLPRRCNNETSLVMHSLNQWLCIAEDPRFFAGEGNMILQAGRQHADRIDPTTIGNIVLWDKFLTRVVNPSVNNFRRTWDDTMPDGSRRFEVRCNSLDVNRNQMFLNPYNPIECLPNVCTNVRFMHRDVKPDFERGTCDCGDFDITRVKHIDPSDESSMCASIIDEMDLEHESYHFRVPCVALDTPVTMFNQNMFLCPGGGFNNNTDFAFRFTLTGVYSRSGNGIDEPTYRFYQDTNTRLNWMDTRERNNTKIVEIE